jgi:hypothetical protein
MSTYTVSIYLSIEAETEEEAQQIAGKLEVVPKNEADEEKIYEPVPKFSTRESLTEWP